MVDLFDWNMKVREDEGDKEEMPSPVLFTFQQATEHLINIKCINDLFSVFLVTWLPAYRCRLYTHMCTHSQLCQHYFVWNML